MPSYKRRRIINSASSTAAEDASSLRRRWIDDLENTREELDVGTRVIDDYLGRPNNWYSNSKRGGTHSHDFTVGGYRQVEVLFEELGKGGDVDIGVVKSAATQRAESDVDLLDGMRETVGITHREMNNVIDRPNGWYGDRVSNPESFPLYTYVRLYIFVENVLMIMLQEGQVEPESVRDLVNRGLDEEVLELAA